jgi:hypothetical protein
VEGALPPRPEHARQAPGADRRLRCALPTTRDPGPEQHIDVDRPGELVGIDCFYVGRLRHTEGAIWQLSAIDVCSSFAWAELVVAKKGNPTARQTSAFARRVVAELNDAGWALERLLSDDGNEFKGEFTTTATKLNTRQTRIHAGRPQTNGNVEALHKTILDECWRPAFARATSTQASAASSRAEHLPQVLQLRPRPPRPHTRKHRLRCTQDGGQMSRTCRHISESAHIIGEWPNASAYRASWKSSGSG